jgi:hypothetical protein
MGFALALIGKREGPLALIGKHIGFAYTHQTVVRGAQVEKIDGGCRARGA